mmetsp:Transcript_30716/g.64435  ORF Transcript_30716/g.64435 Transcript_30716/m.64435 type:complete len:103 (+) Transcript_30716:430-738(+)
MTKAFATVYVVGRAMDGQCCSVIFAKRNFIKNAWRPKNLCPTDKADGSVLAAKSKVMSIPTNSVLKMIFRTLKTLNVHLYVRKTMYHPMHPTPWTCGRHLAC